jgi:hypothetical protein
MTHKPCLDCEHFVAEDTPPAADGALLGRCHKEPPQPTEMHQYAFLDIKGARDSPRGGARVHFYTGIGCPVRCGPSRGAGSRLCVHQMYTKGSMWARLGSRALDLSRVPTRGGVTCFSMMGPCAPSAYDGPSARHNAHHGAPHAHAWPSLGWAMATTG